LIAPGGGGDEDNDSDASESAAAVVCNVAGLEEFNKRLAICSKIIDAVIMIDEIKTYIFHAT
jgi:hypothetical protein